jgi:predicted NBD/HSP70 family sugar kinase
MDTRTTTTRDIRRQNRSLLLTKLFFDGPLSRLELSQLTGLSSATVSTVTGELLDDELIVEAGQVESNGGRPRVLLRVDPAYGYAIGVDVGETGVTVELFDLGMHSHGCVVRPLRSAQPTPHTVVTEVVTGIADVLAGVASADGAAPRVIGVGIGVPGIVDQADRTVHAPTIGWTAVPLADLLREAGATAPLYLGNGAKTQAQAEIWFGAARGARHAVIALVGSGVGAAVITDGVPYQGTSSSAGEWGHTTLVFGGRACRCGARGCLEAYVGAEGILDRYAEAVAAAAPAGADEGAGLEALIAAADAGGPAATLLAETATYLGAGIGNLINMFNPERVVLGGWAGLALGEKLLPQIRAAAQAQALAQPYGRVSIELSKLGADAVAFGAATLPLSALLTQGGDPARAS